jgi:hypothetical protein
MEVAKDRFSISHLTFFIFHLRPAHKSQQWKMENFK